MGGCKHGRRSIHEEILQMGSSLPGIAIALLLLGVSCSGPGSSGGQKEKSSLEPILGALDVPAPGATMKGAMTVAGWAVAESGVQRVALYIDQRFAGFASVGGNRPDIAKAYATFPDAATSAWGAVVDLSPFTPGDHQIVMQVKTKAGNVHDFPAVPFKIR